MNIEDNGLDKNYFPSPKRNYVFSIVTIIIILVCVALGGMVWLIVHTQNTPSINPNPISQTSSPQNKSTPVQVRSAVFATEKLQFPGIASSSSILPSQLPDFMQKGIITEANNVTADMISYKDATSGYQTAFIVSTTSMDTLVDQMYSLFSIKFQPIQMRVADQASFIEYQNSSYKLRLTYVLISNNIRVTILSQKI